MDDALKAKLAVFLKGEIAYAAKLPKPDKVKAAIERLKKLKASAKELRKSVDAVEE